jgi:hypothetical protein
MGTGLSGVSYNGSSAVTVAIANTTVTANSYGSATAVPTYTVNAQGQLTAASNVSIAIPSSAITDKGLPNGIASLDSGGTVPLTQLPASIKGGLVYQGTWNASTNTPTLVSSVGTANDYYVVSVAGTTNLNGVAVWAVNDLAIFSGSVWQKVSNSNPTIITANSTTPALSVTQTGTGNAFVVEDSVSPDATPFVIDNAGNVSVGGTLTISGFAVVDQSDIGTAPNEIPLNQYLGALAYQGNEVITYLQNQINALYAAVYSLLPVSVNFVSLQDCSFEGTAKQPIGVAVDSTNSGNNTGWTFV